MRGGHNLFPGKHALTTSGIKFWSKGFSIEKALFLAAAILVFFSMLYLFYRYASWTAGKDYFSDLPSHIAFATEGSREGDYSLTLFIFRLICLIGGDYSHLLIAVFLATIQLLTIYAVYKLWVQIDVMQENTPTIHTERWYRWGGLSLLFVMSIYIPVIYGFFYFGTISAQAWHNSTYMTMRLLSVIALTLYFKIDKGYLHKLRAPDMISFSLAMILTTWAKPNFLIGFAPVMAINLLIDFIHNIKDRQKVKRIFIFGLTIMPAALIIAFQTWVLFGESESALKFTFGAFYFHWGNPVLMPLLGLAFPILVMLYNKGRLYTARWYRSIWLLWLFNFMIFFFLMETGLRESHGNMLWGLIFATFLLFAGSFYVFLHDRPKSKIFTVFCGLSFLLSLISGMI